MIRFHKIAACVLAALLLLSASGCSSDTPNSSSSEIEGGQVSSTAAAIQYEPEAPKKTLTYAMAEAPVSADPALVLSNSLASEFVYHTSEGLVRLYNNKVIPGIAESWETEDDITFTFHLRYAMWEDGMQITADDFVYSLKRLLDPDTGAVLSDGMLLIENAMAYRAGNVSEDELGITALDDTTLQITLEEAAPYFVEILASDTHAYLVRQDIIYACGDTFATGSGTYLSCGPFRIADWDEQQIVLEKNEMYWDASKVNLERIVCTFIPDGATRATMYAAGDCNAYIELLDSNSDKYDDAKSAVTNTLISVVTNDNSSTVGNQNFRNALNYAINRNELVTDAISGTVPAIRFIPDIKLTDGSDFTKSHPVDSLPASGDITQAKAYLADALKELEKSDVSELDEIVFLCSESSKSTAEALLQTWRTELGLTKILIEALPSDELLEKCLNGEYDLFLQTSTGYYTDPYMQLSAYASDALYNLSNWSSEEYDTLLSETHTLTENERLSKLQECEQYLLDNGPSIPLYFRGFSYGYSSAVSGIGVSSVGAPLQFIYAEVSDTN